MCGLEQIGDFGEASRSFLCFDAGGSGVLWFGHFLTSCTVATHLSQHLSSFVNIKFPVLNPLLFEVPGVVSMFVTN
jgi:hypothetical protein